MMEPGLPVGNRRPQKQALDGLLQIRGRVKGSCRSSDWTITKTKTVTRCGRCRHEPGWDGWLAGWLGRWLKWENFGSAPELGARRDGSFNCGPCSPAALDYVRVPLQMRRCPNSRFTGAWPYSIAGQRSMANVITHCLNQYCNTVALSATHMNCHISLSIASYAWQPASNTTSGNAPSHSSHTTSHQNWVEVSRQLRN